MKNIRWAVFLPPFLLLIASAIYSLVNVKHFFELANTANTWILTNFGWLFSISTLSFLVICIWVYFSPIAHIKIGGSNAQPILTKWRWFTITLCTTVAVGILFWGTAEPIYHLHGPPSGLGIEADSPAAATFALSTMYLHWSFTPYSIYTLASLVFALVYYNLKQPFSLGSLLYPLIGDKAHGNFGKIIDAICLYSLVTGMAASLGTGILSISGGLEQVLGISNNVFVFGMITLAIVLTFIISSASGLMKGIRFLSDMNVKVFFALCIFIFIFGPTLHILRFSTESIGNYFQHFFERSLYTGAAADDGWANSWTIFYWANWLAWTPITALFLGRLAAGYTVRDFIKINLIFPSLFSIAWMSVFSSTAIFHQDVLTDLAAENMIYAIFQQLPLPQLTSFIFILIAFLSYVTAADSNTSAMGGISSTGISPTSPESSVSIKIIWGITVGVISWVMVSFAGIDGIKMTSNLGGFPALFLVIAVAFSLIKIVRNPKLL